MKRYAAHYILIQPYCLLKQHYIELDANDCILKIAPLTEEIAGTVFYDGILIVYPSKPSVFIYQLTGINLSSSELGTSDCGSHCHVQRL